MGKLILFLIIIGAIYFFFIKKPQVENKEDNDKDLVMCDKCKTFYPSDEIIKVGDKNICKDCYDNS